jgi:multicomponent Na+:H+ antiporter subunit A
MLIVIIIGFFAAIVSPFIHKVTAKYSGIILSFYPISVFVFLCSFIPSVSDGEIFLLENTWFPALGININFLIDGLSLTFGLIISGIGAIIIIYASSYLHGHKKLARFYAYLLFFMTPMLGVVLSDNIFTLFIFWELTSISSYLLIGFNHETDKSRYAALQALLVTGGGGLAMMAGFIMMGTVGGSYSISELINQSALITEHHLYIPILILILLGAFTKSAQWPFHFWLPNAMEAPTPVSAYLHSATMVKAGVFLLARFTPILSGPEIWNILLISFGGFTMLVAAAMAIGQNDLKRILAYTTVSALGIMVFLLGLGGQYAITAAITFLVVHSLYKGGLFLIVGAIDHETGTRDIRMLGGLRKYLPFITIAAVLAALSYSGIPPFFGFIAKELIYEAAASYHVSPVLLTSIAVLTNMFLVATAILVGIKPFFGKWIETPKTPHHEPFKLWIGPVILGVLGLLFGIIPWLMSDNLIDPGVMAIGKIEAVKLSIWHGFNVILMLSLVTLIGGICIFFLSRFVKKQQAFFDTIAKFGPEAIYNVLLKGLVSFASFQTNFFQNGNLRSYFYYIIGMFVGLFFFTVAYHQLYEMITLNLTNIYLYEVLVVIIMILAIILSIISKSVISAIAALGIVGFGVALLFSFFSAPDLAFTQFSIETLSVILLVLVARKVPSIKNFSSKLVLGRDAFISIIAGLTVTSLVLIVLNNPAETKISTYFLENSYVLAHGRNVVNVILVDFRALDTMGEITVLSLAAIGVYTLLKFRSRNNYRL